MGYITRLLVMASTALKFSRPIEARKLVDPCCPAIFMVFCQAIEESVWPGCTVPSLNRKQPWRSRGTLSYSHLYFFCQIYKRGIMVKTEFNIDLV